MTTLRVTARADRDFNEILFYLDEQAGATIAAEYSQRLKRLYDRLLEFPQIGSPRSSLGRGIRGSLMEPYIVFYRFVRDRDRIDILRILHGHRDIQRALFQPSRGSS